jgi:PPK2 family polyphosphate:nucleotide phosphotransferase
MGPLNSQGCEVTSFKVPTAPELAHDFLWRIHARAPARGQIGIFNRSHYEDVLVVRVHDLVGKEVWRRRYKHINRFEKMLVDANTLVLKFYLHISRAEQQKRLLERQQDRSKFWKLSVGDWQEREYWNAYVKAYEDVLNRCSTPEAPWYIVPADKKWFRNLAIAETIVDALKPYEKGWLTHLDGIGRQEMAKIKAFQESNKGKAEAQS